jgi:transposase
MKERAQYLLQDGWEMEEVVTALGVSDRSIQHWLNNYEQEGQVDPPRVLRGRRRLLSTAAITDLFNLVAESPSLYLDEIQEWLAIHHFNSSQCPPGPRSDLQGTQTDCSATEREGSS